MGRMGRDTKLKRQLAPAFWEIGRKEKRFALKVSPGPHVASESYPLGIVLRDILKVVSTMREASQALTSGNVKVDGVIRRSTNFPVGLMDVIEIPSISKAYRMVPKDGVILRPIEISDDEKTVKLCKVTRKVTVKNKKLQYGFHDGRTLIDDLKVNVHDTCLMTVPELKVTKTIKLEKGSTALIVSGDNAGTIGNIDDIRDGTFILPKRALVRVGEKKVELPVDMVLAVGTDKPVIKVS